MARRSTITMLDPRIKEAIDTLIREDRATIDDIVEAIQALGGQVSRSAVGRHVKSAREQMQRYREAQEVAKVWIGKLEAEPEGDVGRLLSEMLRTVAWQTIGAMGDEDAEKVMPMDIMLIAKSLDHLAKADKAGAERTLKVRRAVQVKTETTAKEVEQIARKAGLTAEGAAAIRAKILGIAA